MSKFELDDFQNEMDENMTVTLSLEDGDITCKIVTILEVDKKDYIVLNPLDKKGNSLEEVWFYGYKENPNNPNDEPELIDILDDDEYEAVTDKYEEYLDNLDFDEMD